MVLLEKFDARNFTGFSAVLEKMQHHSVVRVTALACIIVSSDGFFSDYSQLPVLKSSIASFFPPTIPGTGRTGFQPVRAQVENLCHQVFSILLREPKAHE
jgi:hypothetical protein